MPQFKCSLFLSTGWAGFSENWYREDADYSSAKGYLNDLAQKRLAMCGAGVSIDYLRVSDENILRDSFVSSPHIVTIGPSSPVPGNRYAVQKVQWGDPDQPVSGVHVRVEATAQHHSSLAVRGIPDDLIIWPNGPSNLVGWDKAFQAWRTALMTGFKLRVRDQQAPNNKRQILIAKNDAAGVWHLGTDGQPPGSGTRVRINNFRGEPGSENVNKIWVVDLVDNAAGTFTLDGFPTSSDPDFYFEPVRPITGTYQTVAYAYVGITDVLIRGQRSRKPGRPFDQRPGRRRVRH